MATKSKGAGYVKPSIVGKGSPVANPFGKSAHGNSTPKDLQVKDKGHKGGNPGEFHGKSKKK